MNAKSDRNPLAEIIELLGKKWVLRILWELREEPLTFRELRAACDNLSPSVLNQRLKLLEDALLITKNSPSGYALTSIAQELSDLYPPLKSWATRWVEHRAGQADMNSELHK